MSPSMSQAAPSAPTPSTPPTPDDKSMTWEEVDPKLAGQTASPAQAPKKLTEAELDDKYIKLTPVAPPEPTKTQPVVDTGFSNPTEDLKERLEVLEAREAEKKVNELNEVTKPAAEQPMPEVGSPVQTADSAPVLKDSVNINDGTPNGRLLRDIAEKNRGLKPGGNYADYTPKDFIDGAKADLSYAVKENLPLALGLPATSAAALALMVQFGSLGTLTAAIAAGTVTTAALAALIPLVAVVAGGTVGFVKGKKIFKAWNDKRKLTNALKANNFNKVEPAVPEQRYTLGDAVKGAERIRKNGEAEKARQAQTPVGPSDYSVTNNREAEGVRKGWRGLFQLGRH